MNEISSKKQEILTKHGFVPGTGRDVDCYFRAPVWVLDSRMIVNGDHADDYATVVYAVEDTSESGVLEGLFYSPSMLEYLLTDFGGEWDPQEMIDDLCMLTGNDVLLVGAGGMPSIFIEIYEDEWTRGDLHSPISDILKSIGALDLWLVKKRDELREKRRAEK